MTSYRFISTMAAQIIAIPKYCLRDSGSFKKIKLTRLTNTTVPTLYTKNTRKDGIFVSAFRKKKVEK